jgi:hypothetical protein
VFSTVVPAPLDRSAPWERRAEFGFLRELTEQRKLSVFSPEVFWRSCPAEGTTTDPLLYAWLLELLQAVPACASRGGNRRTETIERCIF